MKLTRPAGMTRQGSCPQDAHGLAREGRAVSVLSRLAHLLHGNPQPGCPFAGRTERKAEAGCFCTGMILPQAAAQRPVSHPSLARGLGPPARVGKASTPSTRVWR